MSRRYFVYGPKGVTLEITTAKSEDEARRRAMSVWGERIYRKPEHVTARLAKPGEVRDALTGRITIGSGCICNGTTVRDCPTHGHTMESTQLPPCAACGHTESQHLHTGECSQCNCKGYADEVTTDIALDIITEAAREWANDLPQQEDEANEKEYAQKVSAQARILAAIEHIEALTTEQVLDRAGIKR